MSEDQDRMYPTQNDKDYGCSVFGHMPTPMVTQTSGQITGDIKYMLAVICERCKRYLGYEPPKR